MEIVTGWSSVDKLSKCNDVANPGFGERNNIRSVLICRIGKVGGMSSTE